MNSSSVSPKTFPPYYEPQDFKGFDRITPTQPQESPENLEVRTSSVNFAEEAGQLAQEYWQMEFETIN